MGQALVPKFYQACETQLWLHFPGQQVGKGQVRTSHMSVQSIDISDTQSNIHRPLKSTERFPEQESLSSSKKSFHLQSFSCSAVLLISLFQVLVPQ